MLNKIRAALGAYDMSDALTAGGLACVGAGLWQLNHQIAFIACGLLLFGYGVAIDLLALVCAAYLQNRDE